jgi:hypothetical protein
MGSSRRIFFRSEEKKRNNSPGTIYFPRQKRFCSFYNPVFLLKAGSISLKSCESDYCIAQPVKKPLKTAVKNML